MSYTGDVSVAKNGIKCAPWSLFGDSYGGADFPEQSITEASNFCRNPRNEQPPGPWCLVPRGDEPEEDGYNSEFCDILLCSVTGKCPICSSSLKCQYVSYFISFKRWLSAL